MKAAVVVFPGTNCDRDTFRACEHFGWDVEYIWHDETNLNDYDVIFLPGGFSYGDYIRSGRLAKFSPVVMAISDYVKAKRGFVIGICNGFQILCEAGLLPGVLSDNWNTRFICEDAQLESTDTSMSDNITLPIAHGEGRYFASLKTMSELEEKGMIFLTYKNNPNGSIKNIAGLFDRENKIIGMMPHPERAVFKELGNTDGAEIFKLIEREMAK